VEIGVNSHFTNDSLELLTIDSSECTRFMNHSKFYILDRRAYQCLQSLFSLKFCYLVLIHQLRILLQTIYFKSINCT